MTTPFPDVEPRPSAKAGSGTIGRGLPLPAPGSKDQVLPQTVIPATLAQYRPCTTLANLIAFPHRGHPSALDGCRRGPSPTGPGRLRKRTPEARR
ncbi:hypothetical protein [Kitasatospora paranensis]|uniref:Uncharacterized protein n=1 Tax=Kitasatospora paranensis TaxID=258053 RepID=A0ABW2FRQ7_9ACTN